MVGTIIGGMLCVMLIALSINFIYTNYESMKRFGYALGALGVLSGLLTLTGAFQSAWEAIPYK